MKTISFINMKGGVAKTTTVVEVGTKEELGGAIGKETRAVLVVADTGFGKKILELLEQMR